MRILFTALIFMASLFLMLCDHQPSYAEDSSQRPYSTSRQDIDAKCAWIRNEIAKANSLIAMYANRRNAAFIKAVALKKIAELENRAAVLKCRSAFSSTHIMEKQNPTSSIDECIEACKKYTNRTSEQCFDACNK